MLDAGGTLAVFLACRRPGGNCAAAWRRENVLKGSNRFVLVTCEHGGNQVPHEWHYLFEDAEAILQSHRGWDKGALELAKGIADTFNIKLITEETTRLLIDLNRSLHHRDLFSEFTGSCDIDTKHSIIDEIYLPYRNRIEAVIAAAINQQQTVLHLSVHSFTPVLDKTTRHTDIGLLYDPDRKPEMKFCLELQNSINKITDEWRVRRNYPYRGIADGLTTYLRKKHSDAEYCGIELEVNQAIISNKKQWRSLKQTIISALGSALGLDEN